MNSIANSVERLRKDTARELRWRWFEGFALGVLIGGAVVVLVGS